MEASTNTEHDVGTIGRRGQSTAAPASLSAFATTSSCRGGKEAISAGSGRRGGDAWQQPRFLTVVPGQRAESEARAGLWGGAVVFAPGSPSVFSSRLESPA